MKWNLQRTTGVTAEARSTASAPGLARRLLGTFRNEGMMSVLRDLRSSILYQLHKRILERRFHDNELPVTRQRADLKGLRIDSDNRDEGVDYAPTPHLVIQWIRQLLPDDVRDWTFVDVGAGRGRVVAAAAAFPYRRVLGVEFALELQRDAIQLLQSLPAERRVAKEIDVIHADAANFDIPTGPCVFYLFNPFGQSVLEAFLANVVASHRADPRPMRIAYFNPVHADAMMAFEEIHRCKLPLKVRAKFAALCPNPFALFEVS